MMGGQVCAPYHKNVRKIFPGGDSVYERGGDARRKFWIKPLKETDLEGAQAFLTPKRDHNKTQTIYIFRVQP